MNVIWNGHSCFTLETAEGSVVFDPYQDGSVPGYGPLRLSADRVLCSHGHRDHGAKELVSLSGRAPSYQVEEIHTFHDPEKGALRGPNTIHIIAAEGLRIAHLGDLGCALEPEQVEKLRGLDAVLIPVGGFFTIDAKQAQQTVEQLGARVVIPMHYRSPGFGYDAIGPLEDFLALRGDVVRYEGNTLGLTRDTPAQTAVLAYLG